MRGHICGMACEPHSRSEDQGLLSRTKNQTRSVGIMINRIALRYRQSTFSCIISFTPHNNLIG